MNSLVGAKNPLVLRAQTPPPPGGISKWLTFASTVALGLTGLGLQTNRH